MKERIKHLILLIILIGIDQLSKFWVRTYLVNPKRIDIIPDVLNLQQIGNHGAAWGIMSGKMDFLRVFTLILLLLIIFLYFKIPEGKKFKILKLLAVFMIAGAIGNLIDRFFLGYVVDFIYFELINFPLFNFADSCLTVASFILFFLAIFYYKDEDFAFLSNMFKRKKADSNLTEEVSDAEEDEFQNEDQKDTTDSEEDAESGTKENEVTSSEENGVTGTKLPERN